MERQPKLVVESCQLAVECVAAAGRGTIQHMVDSQTLSRQKAFTESFDDALKRARKSLAEVVRHFDGKPSEQAIYRWPKTGKISEANLKRLTTFLECDYTAARTSGKLVPRKVALPKAGEKASDVPALIYSKVRKLDQTAQLSVLNLIETMINIASVRYWEYVGNTKEAAELER